ncbi:MAG: ATP-dependent DNA helicase [Chloroflexota bacterium]|jgi:DNA helicase-2/ATP-dependent DNA helicase PcrA
MTAIREQPDGKTNDRAAPDTGPPVDIDGLRELLRGLDRRQRQAVTHKDGPMLVVAGPGTGKTEVITRRVAWLVASRRARPSQVLALTFTDRAANEMQARVDLLLPYGQADAAVHTFHAFGDQLLREHGHEIGRPEDPRVIGRTQAMVLLRDNVFGLGLDRYLPLGDPTRFVGALVDLFARAKEEGTRPEELAAYAAELAAGTEAALRGLPHDAPCEPLLGLLDEAQAQAELARAYSAYQDLLVTRSLVDHGDQVAEAVRLLEARPAVRLALRRRYRYVVVDEAQDANPQQLRLVRQLVGAHGNVTFVGDDDQAIYAFRGAVGQGLAGLGTLFPALRDVVLRRNYRSRKPILEAARRLIRHNDPDRLEVQRGLDKTLTAVRRTRRPALVRHQVYRTAADEADAVAAEIRQRLEQGTPPNAVGVLVRTNADAAPVLASLDVIGIPYRFSGASGLLAQREVRDVLSLLRTIASPDTSQDLYAVLTAAPYGLGGEDLTAICDLATRRRRSLWSVITEIAEQPGLLRLQAATRRQLVRAVEHIRDAIGRAHERPAPVVLYDFLGHSGWLKLLVGRAEQGDDGPLRRVARVFELVKEQADLVGDPRLATVVPALGGLIDAGHDPVAPDADDLSGAVSVLTVHQAKGLEFPVVYVVGAADGRFPVRARKDPLALPVALTGHPAADDPERQRAEERRLFYVAMTRARDELILSHAVHGRDGGRPRRPSPFLAEALGREVDSAAQTTGPLLPRAATVPGTATVIHASAAAPGPLSLSFTQIDDYLTCPLKYRLRHLVRVPTPPHHALVFGNAVHQAVAAANARRLRGLPVERRLLDEALAAHWRSEGFISQEHETARYAAGQAALARFAERATSAADTIVAVEQPFSVHVGGDRIRGRYDAVRQTEDGIVVTDYKSGDVRDPGRARQRAHDSLQLQVYALAWEAEHGQRPAAVELHFLEGDVIGRVIPSARRLERARAKVERAAAGIRAGDFTPTPGYPACDWCPYRRICPAAP